MRAHSAAVTLIIAPTLLICVAACSSSPSTSGTQPSQGAGSSLPPTATTTSASPPATTSTAKQPPARPAGASTEFSGTYKVTAKITRNDSARPEPGQALGDKSHFTWSAKPSCAASPGATCPVAITSSSGAKFMFTFQSGVWTEKSTVPDRCGTKTGTEKVITTLTASTPAGGPARHLSGQQQAIALRNAVRNS